MPGFFTTMGKASNYVSSTLSKVGRGLSAAGEYIGGAWMGATGGAGVRTLSEAGKTGYIHGTEAAAGLGWGSHMAQRYGARGYDYTRANSPGFISDMHGALGGALGTTGRNAVYGAAAGAGWGMMSDDTSVLGGAIMGAGVGAVGGRYGGAAYKEYKNVIGKQFYRKGAHGAMYQRTATRGDALTHALRRARREVSLDANRAFNAVGSTLSWRMP